MYLTHVHANHPAWEAVHVNFQFWESLSHPNFFLFLYPPNSFVLSSHSWDIYQSVFILLRFCNNSYIATIFNFWYSPYNNFWHFLLHLFTLKLFSPPHPHPHSYPFPWICFFHLINICLIKMWILQGRKGLVNFSQLNSLLMSLKKMTPVAIAS